MRLCGEKLLLSQTSLINICINYSEESCKHRFEVMFNQDLQLEIGNKEI